MMKTSATVALISPSPLTQRSLLVHRYGAVGARPKAYLQAGLHADELPGLLVLHHLQTLLDKAEENNDIIGEIVIVPVANPIGLGQHLNGHLVGRFDFETGKNFNRDFPNLTTAVLEKITPQLTNSAPQNVQLIRDCLQTLLQTKTLETEPEGLKRALLRLSIDADYVLDLHCDGEAIVHLYVSKHHEAQGVQLGAQLGAKTILLEDNAGGDPFDEANAGIWWKLREQLPTSIPLPLACFATTIELRGQADVDETLARSDALNLFRYLQRCGLIAGHIEPLPTALCEPTPLEGTDVLKAPIAGVLAYHKTLGEYVHAGEVVADVVNITASSPEQARIPVISQTDGIIFARRLEKLVRPGESFCKIAGKHKLAHREYGKLLGNK
ncbi:putative deacylase [Beggiatoa alba B18LD]|uniref:Putative deacylase n=1 Tax=Beggiatoa alba B18LD TaxID=395493 RepID=I3CFY3_9GAMM|nr:succinylglutamate desuccinylase/aspartoacylase family protein [Beggiatoa alba]EIJ42526.1 putative deacylase [Beggiatoa alba B18LD]